ncbi:MAG: hypothetical protein EG822_18045 [Deltaproteobacteria bacterium]|nr:hypothetical protein [Deltaproteobacteria bacterium]TLN00915.1 MAG: hypothetical protein FDZ73_17815 [bacterium]
MRHYFLTGEYGRRLNLEGGEKAAWLILCGGEEIELLNHHRDTLLADWIKENPCSRPWFWWEYDAPKEPVSNRFREISFHARRERIGGTGSPSWEHLNIGPCFSIGLPCSWVSSFDEAYYNGRAVDIHGNIIPTNYKEGHFKGKAIDPNDPPTFESEAAYLSRHGLLTKEEKAYLKKFPKLLEPEAVVFDECDEEEAEPAACTPQ